MTETEVMKIDPTKLIDIFNSLAPFGVKYKDLGGNGLAFYLTACICKSLTDHEVSREDIICILREGMKFAEHWSELDDEWDTKVKKKDE